VRYLSLPAKTDRTRPDGSFGTTKVYLRPSDRTGRSPTGEPHRRTGGRDNAGRRSSDVRHAGDGTAPPTGTAGGSDRIVGRHDAFARMQTGTWTGRVRTHVPGLSSVLRT